MKKGILKTENMIVVIKVILGTLFLLVLMSTVINFFLWNAGLRELEFTPTPFNEAKEVNYVKQLRAVSDNYKQQAQLRDIYPITRNYFAPYIKDKKEVAPFYIKDIVYEPLFFMYRGHIEKSPSELIAQINWGNRTYFVRKDESIKEWRVTNIEKEQVVVINDSKEEIALPLNKRIFQKKPYAIIGIQSTKDEFKINIGDEVKGYKVLDITKDTVILSINSKTISIAK